MLGILVTFWCWLGTGFADTSVYTPEQIHISLGDNPSEMVVVWSTGEDPGQSVVEYGSGPTSLNSSANGTRQILSNGVAGTIMQYIHRVKLTGLEPGQKYWYRPGSDRGWGTTYSFRTLQNSTNWSPRFGVYGDLGLDNARCLKYLVEEVKKENFDVILHDGDFAYDMHMDSGRVGDKFFRALEPIAARIPYMVATGNHEFWGNFRNYRLRFSMPGTEDNKMYSFKVGPAFIVVFDTEAYYMYEYGSAEQVNKQYKWFEKTLQEANQPENRKQWPWIITMGHRPMYCSNDEYFNCGMPKNKIREGIDFLKMPGLEKLMFDYGVDLAIWGHQHSYERLWPVYDEEVYNGTVAPYTNPGATVHIITGSPGNMENLDYFLDNPEEWSAFQSSDYGYSRMTVFNKTHLYFDQVADKEGGQVIDSFWLIKDYHGPYAHHRPSVPPTSAGMS